MSERKALKDTRRSNRDLPQVPSSSASITMRYAMKTTAMGGLQSSHSGSSRDPIVASNQEPFSSGGSLYEWVWNFISQKTADASKGNPQDAMDSALEEASRIVEARREELEARNKTQAAELRAALGTIERLDAELERARADARRNADAYEALKKQHDAKSALLDSRTDTLHAAEQFLTKYDEFGGDEVENGLRDINSQILTIAGTCSDFDNLQEYFKRPKKKRDQPAELSKDMIDNLGHIVGEKLLSVLARLDYVEDQIAVQLSMQAIMCFFVSRVCEIYPYSPTRRAKSGKGIWDIYPTVHANEMQAVAARWRSISCKHSKSPGVEDDLVEEMISCTTQYLSRILLIAGVHTDLSKLHRFCEHAAGDSMKVFWTIVIQYIEKLKEKVHSTDYSVVSFFARTEYDHSMMKMQGSVLEKNKKQPEGKVLCTTELGLRRDTNMAKPGESAKGQMKSEIIVKSVVIFDKELDAMIAH